MGTRIDVVVAVAGSVDAVTSIGGGSQGGGPAGSVGQTVSTGGAVAQAIGSIVGVTPIAGVITNAVGLVGNALTAVQITIDLNDGQAIKVGDVISIGAGIPVGMALATGALAASSILIPMAAITGLLGSFLNIAGITTDDIFKLLDSLDGHVDGATVDQVAIDAVIDAALPISGVASYRRMPNISNQCNRFYNSARAWTAPRDPLVLDLDGDGIETLAINPASPILFDMDADGVKTGTGWVKPDDALVVLDRNGNGLIDSGAELFGDSTVLQNGPRAGQKAANGFEALADLDANADGVINSADAAYASLRLWQDANQDGISQSTELKTLATLGIASINVSGTASNVNLVDGSGQATGNTQVFTGSFTRTNGQSGTAGVAELAGSLLLATNNFYREFTDDPVVTAAAKALPQMRGSGKLINTKRHEFRSCHRAIQGRWGHKWRSERKKSALAIRRKCASVTHQFAALANKDAYGS